MASVLAAAVTSASMSAAGLVAFGCSAPTTGGDSETHWIVCKTTRDCHGGQTCENEHCVNATTSDAAVPDARSPDAGTSPPILDAQPTVMNPTGTCRAPDSGARRGYHSPDAGDLWLPDCNNPLKREYYRVFAKSSTSAYVIPRPDGAHELELPCNDPTHVLRGLVEQYSLCQSAGDTATVDKINSMPPADALALTHYMHGQLVFEPVEGILAMNLRPYAIPSDVVDACALHPDERSSELSVDCTAQQKAIDTGTDGPLFGTTAPELAKLLNELYGVAGGCTRPEFAARICTACGPSGGCATTELRCTRSCSTQSECAGATAGSECAGTVCAPLPYCI